MQTKMTKKQIAMQNRRKEILAQYQKLRDEGLKRNEAVDKLTKEHELTNSTIQRIMYDPNYPFNKKDLQKTK